MVSKLPFLGKRAFLMVFGLALIFLLFAMGSCHWFGDLDEDIGQTCNGSGLFVNTDAKCKAVMLDIKNKCTGYRFFPNNSYPDPKCKGYDCKAGCWFPD